MHIKEFWSDILGILLAQGEGIDRSRADFIVGRDTEQWGGLPHTEKRHGQCGIPQSKPIYLPESFVRNPVAAVEVFGDNLGISSFDLDLKTISVKPFLFETLTIADGSKGLVFGNYYF